MGRWQLRGRHAHGLQCDGHTLELAVGHPVGESGQVGHERAFKEKCVTPKDSATINKSGRQNCTVLMSIKPGT